MNGRVDIDTVRDAFSRLGLTFAAEALAEALNDAVKEELPPHTVVNRLLTVELERREERRIRTALKLSGLPPGMTLGNFDFSFQPSIERSRIETLSTCAFVRQRETILIQGPPGTGKTHLSVALGVKAVGNGFSVAFYTLDALLHAARRDADRPPQRLKGLKYHKSSLLIIDEMGFQPLSRSDASLLFRVVNYRYDKGSTIITTNKSVKDWPEILAGDEVMATAILDRLLHRSHVLNVTGRSYRLKDLENMLK
ncbi:IS21-like element helper ATPase IstB [Desulfovibrio sp. TomC]|jgi:DNA replication protein DnaC|uniref:IS21-like element helper ATPase IstB n=1 Tax=Desulfovibrio sp. TomC TaxID=1562888 RepID=UPI000573143C|nr:IS21-like element helper ATPase IstB [Desulfovibrio sp. TomC]KHK01655.1 Mobile element protein [Desulfovibrio sp. TomC]